MPITKIRIGFLLFVVLFGTVFPFRIPVSASEDTIYKIEINKTINIGNQGLYIGNPPSNIKFVEIIKIRPPLPVSYTSGIEIFLRAPALEITYLDENENVVKPDEIFSSVYFNLTASNLEKWETGGPDEISIWYYDKIWKNWSMCSTRYIEGTGTNGNHGRLACFFKGNGIYVLGRIIFDADKNIYPLDGPATINLGKQGLFISNPPSNAAYVKIERIFPPIPSKFTFGIDLAYRGPALEITFLNINRYVIKPGATLTSVYFNISEPEVRMWENGGTEEIAIWYYNESSEEWRLCTPRYIPEKQNNEKYDRLACLVMGNGFYVLGKMEFDPVFPLWFKGYDRENKNRIQDY